MWRHPFSRQALRVFAIEVEGVPAAVFEILEVAVRQRDATGTKALRGACLASGFVRRDQRRSGLGRRLAGAIGRRMADEGIAVLYGVSETSMKVYSELEPEIYPIVEVAAPAVDAKVDSQAVLVHDLAGWTPPPLAGALDVLLTAEMLG